MTDIIEKAQALQNLVGVYRDLGDMKALDAMLASVRRDSEAEREAAESRVSDSRKSGSKRGPYKLKGIYKALLGAGVIHIDELVKRTEAFQHVSGKTPEGKADWVEEQMRKSKPTYRDWPDRYWSLRKDDAPAQDAPTGK